MNTSKIVEIGPRWSGAERAASRPPVAGNAAPDEAVVAATVEASPDSGRARERVQPVQPGTSSRFERPQPLFVNRYGVVEGTFQPYLEIALRPKQDFAFRVFGKPEPLPELADTAGGASAYSDRNRATRGPSTFETVA